MLAVPGSVRSSASEGTNSLIADGCGVARDAADVLAALELACAQGPVPSRALPRAPRLGLTRIPSRAARRASSGASRRPSVPCWKFWTRPRSRSSSCASAPGGSWRPPRSPSSASRRWAWRPDRAQAGSDESPGALRPKATPRPDLTIVLWTMPARVLTRGAGRAGWRRRARPKDLGLTRTGASSGRPSRGRGRQPQRGWCSCRGRC